MFISRLFVQILPPDVEVVRWPAPTLACWQEGLEFRCIASHLKSFVNYLEAGMSNR